MIIPYGQQVTNTLTFVSDRNDNTSRIFMLTIDGSSSSTPLISQPGDSDNPSRSHKVIGSNSLKLNELDNGCGLKLADRFYQFMINTTSVRYREDALHLFLCAVASGYLPLLLTLARRG
jgi:hypothetical protein